MRVLVTLAIGEPDYVGSIPMGQPKLDPIPRPFRTTFQP